MLDAYKPKPLIMFFTRKGILKYYYYITTKANKSEQIGFPV